MVHTVTPTGTVVSTYVKHTPNTVFFFSVYLSDHTTHTTKEVFLNDTRPGTCSWFWYWSYLVFHGRAIDGAVGHAHQYRRKHLRKPTNKCVKDAFIWKKPTRVAAPSPRASLGRRTVCGRMEQHRPPVSKRCETKVGMVWGSFLIAAAALKTPTINGYNAQGVHLPFCTWLMKVARPT